MKKNISNKKVIVFQHVETENLERIEEYLLTYNLTIKIIKLYLNESIPNNLEDFFLMIVLGGPMDTWMEEEYPWLKKEKIAIKKFVIDLNKPFIGICLGCQLLGEIIGGKIIKSKKPEIGFYDIYTNKNIYKDKNLFFFPKKFTVFQWHSYEVKQINSSDIKVLAYSKSTINQIFRYKTNAYGIQFHIELKENTINKWSSDKSFMKTLKKIYGKDPNKKIKKEYKKQLNTMNLICKKFIFNYLDNLKILKKN